MATSFPRWLLVLLAVTAVVVFAVWITTPAALTSTEAHWQQCFGSMKLSYPAQGTTMRITPDVRPRREAAPILAARLQEPGLDFDSAKLSACLRLGDQTPTLVHVASVVTPAVGAGEADVEIELPSESFPWLDWRRGLAGSLAVVTTDGVYAWTGEFVYPSRFWAFLLATAASVLLFVLLVWLRDAGEAWKTWLMGVFLGEDRQPSLSLFQILLWTIVTVWSLLFVFFSTGNLLSITPQVMGLLGFAGAGSLAARWVATSRQPVRAPQAGDDNEKVPEFWAILENNGQLDLFKLQLFLFTVLIAAYVMFRVLRQSAFPELDPELLTLMGVSNSLYVGSKFAQPSPLAQARELEVERDVLRLRVEDLENEKDALEAQSNTLAQRITQEPDEANKQRLTDQKSIVDSKITNKQAEIAQARIDRDEKEKKYKEAIAALATA